jgi:arsenate reductase
MALTTSGEEVLLLHNPRCSKSRQVKAMLEDRGVPFTERRYLDQPLDPDELRELSQCLGQRIQDWTRCKEQAFAQAGLDTGSSEDAYIDALATHPILMERPILVHAGTARVGRPPEQALELLP